MNIKLSNKTFLDIINLKYGVYKPLNKFFSREDFLSVSSDLYLSNNNFFPFSTIGSIPQDKKYTGEDSKLIIGNDNIFREHVTINPGT